MLTADRKRTRSTLVGCVAGGPLDAPEAAPLRVHRRPAAAAPFAPAVHAHAVDTSVAEPEREAVARGGALLLFRVDDEDRATLDEHSGPGHEQRRSDEQAT
jgi:hypothetical protein